MDLSPFVGNNNNGSSLLAAAFDSRNDVQDVWTSCFPCAEPLGVTTNPFSAPRVIVNQAAPILLLDDDDVHGDEEKEQTLHIKETNLYVADAVKSLPMQERDHALHDIHGVADLREEKSDFIKEQLHLLDGELEKIKSKRAYYIAKSISPRYVANSNFRLQFLRADNYNAKEAAIRMVRHLEAKLEIFGKEKLTKDITLSDLTEEDIRYMKTGFFQLCSEKDRSGRSILCTQGKLASEIPIETRRRVTWYNYNKAAQDEVTQRKGAVLIVFNYGQRKFSFEAANKVHKLLWAMPARLSALHLCHDYMHQTVLSLVQAILRKKDLGRVRLHYSSRLECVYTLMTFGIPRSIFGSDGTVNTSVVGDTIQKRFVEEQEQKQMEQECQRNNKNNNNNNNTGTISTSTIPPSVSASIISTSSHRLLVVVPNHKDVLLGKGKRVLKSPGNVHCRELMEQYKTEYEQGSRFEKATITRLIFQQIQSQGGRFLKEQDAGWIEVDDDIAKKKISHDYRNFRR